MASLQRCEDDPRIIQGRDIGFCALWGEISIEYQDLKSKLASDQLPPFVWRREMGMIWLNGPSEACWIFQASGKTMYLTFLRRTSIRCCNYIHSPRNLQLCCSPNGPLRINLLIAPLISLVVRTLHWRVWGCRKWFTKFRRKSISNWKFGLSSTDIRALDWPKFLVYFIISLHENRSPNSKTSRKTSR